MKIIYDQIIRIWKLKLETGIWGPESLSTVWGLNNKCKIVSKGPVFGQFLFNAIVFSTEGQANRVLSNNFPILDVNENARSALSGNFETSIDSIYVFQGRNGRRWSPIDHLWPYWTR